MQLFDQNTLHIFISLLSQSSPFKMPSPTLQESLLPQPSSIFSHVPRMLATLTQAKKLNPNINPVIVTTTNPIDGHHNPLPLTTTLTSISPFTTGDE